MTIIKEIAVIAVLGILPICGAYFYGGAEYLAETMTSMLAHKWVIYYTMVASGMFIFVAYLDHKILFKSERIESAHNAISSVLYETASSLLGILRVSSGILTTVGCLWLIFDFDISTWKRPIYLICFGVLGVVECVLINSSLNHIKTIWLRNRL